MDIQQVENQVKELLKQEINASEPIRMRTKDDLQKLSTKPGHYIILSNKPAPIEGHGKYIKAINDGRNQNKFKGLYVWKNGTADGTRGIQGRIDTHLYREINENGVQVGKGHGLTIDVVDIDEYDKLVPTWRNASGHAPKFKEVIEIVKGVRNPRVELKAKLVKDKYYLKGIDMNDSRWDGYEFYVAQVECDFFNANIEVYFRELYGVPAFVKNENR